MATQSFAGPDPRGVLELEGYGNSDAVGITAKRARNDFTIKEAVRASDIILFIKGYGYDGTNFVSTPRAQIGMAATQTWDDDSNGTDMRFSVTPNDSVTLAEAMRISSNGYVGIGNTNPSVALDVTGSINASGAVTFGASALLSVTSAAVSHQQTWGASSAISTFTPTALTLDDGVTFTNQGTTALNGNATVGSSALLSATSATFTNQHLWGTGAAISTFTPTAFSLDDGVTFTNAGITTLNGNVTLGNAEADVLIASSMFRLYSRTAAQLAALAPGAAGEIVGCSDCTVALVCVSSGTGAGAWVEVLDKSATCDD